ncbi:MAG: thioredoxin domain-containing protein [Thermoplasmata archaeon]|nr:thioredoxin domain-containing protein [Thermoplasmata archaeon]MCI4359237.1 thioredoxin domain-containing protein [Thermoplasmata archaeon]
MSSNEGSGAAATGGRRLADARSVYLRSAAEQGIEWYPWGPEPFELAKQLNRPVLLDIGAAWCHWCHVMDEGTYSDSEVVRLINEHFIAVKVDRDEHPEVDRRYQRQVGALSGEGGWPLTGFLTPSGETFLGGTYFPPDEGHGRPGFRRVLGEVDRLWREEPDQVRQNTQAVSESLERLRSFGGGSKRPNAGVSLVAQVRENLSSSYDPVHGGFGHAPKFPHPTAVSFLLWDGFATGENRSVVRAGETLLRMADGGMYDQLGGGFHRYSVDEGWHIPHFEKMGIDNAALLSAYTEGARRFDEPRFVETVRGTVGWIREVLEDPSGGFGSSQDADNAPGDDGRYFTWTRPELKEVLEPVDRKLVARFFGVGTEGRMHHDPEQNVLFRLVPIEEAAQGLDLGDLGALPRLARAVGVLKRARQRRPTPAVDRARYASINGPILGALAQASRALDDPSMLATARRAADTFLDRAYEPERGIAHRLDSEGAFGFGRLEDNAAFAYGLVELAGATAEARYASAAGAILDLIDKAFRSDSGLLSDIAPTLYDGPMVGALEDRVYPVEDTPHLSPNSTAALALLRYGSLTQPEKPFDRARSLLAALAPRLDGAGLFGSGAALALGLLSTPSARIVVEGSGPESDALVRAANRTWHPNLWVFRGLPPEPFSLPEELRAGNREAGAARALVCFGQRCLAPISDPAALRTAIEEADRPTG